ncbi:MAG: quinone-dependent dihydroorotate dehydrogenase [Polyangiaceae bacterium]
MSVSAEATPDDLYRVLLKPVLFLLPAESAHQLAIFCLRRLAHWPRLLSWVVGARAPSDPRLRVQAMGLEFPTPVLMAAGFDKHAEVYESLAALGFGAVEVGTITNEAQPGNPRPRLFRLPEDRALLNRMGFNNCGSEVAATRLSGRRRALVGVNIGKTKRVPDEGATGDYVSSAERLGPVADYVVVNVSSPNTPGLRDLQAVERLRPLLAAVQDALARVCPGEPPPLLVKIAPDLSDADLIAVADLALELGLAGIVATNTTIGRAGLHTSSATLAELGAGGISGAPLKERAFDVLRLLRSRVGPSMTLIAAGGIETVDDAWQRLRAGATLLQVYTALVYEGPLLPSRLALGLLERARRAGFDSLEAALGRAPPPAVEPRASSVQ